MRVTASLIVGILIAGWAAPAAGGPEALFAELGVQRPRTPGSVPELALPDLNGRTVRLTDLRGQVVLLGFFTTT
jgi:cytochrome oxidase Cu insertion factor (SCO1/SenC/PrrC family)